MAAKQITFEEIHTPTPVANVIGDSMLEKLAGRLANSFAKLAVIDDTVLLGNADAAGQLDKLQQHNVHLIINVTRSWPCKFPNIFTYHRVDVDDFPSENLFQHFKLVFDLIEKERSEGRRVLVHCQAGISRSATLVISYVMKRYNIPLAEAYHRVYLQRPVIHPNEGFWQQLIVYETELRGSASVTMIQTSRRLRASVSIHDTRLPNSPSNQPLLNLTQSENIPSAVYEINQPGNNLTKELGLVEQPFQALDQRMQLQHKTRKKIEKKNFF